MSDYYVTFDINGQAGISPGNVETLAILERAEKQRGISQSQWVKEEIGRP